jgi:ABC-type nitrate/sulfonate/bicarbonate transport system substrate-binding protein
MMMRTLLPLLGLAAGLAVSARPAAPLRLGLLNQTATNWVLYVGLAHGDFAAEGIDLQLSIAGASNLLSRDLRQGAVDVGHMAAGNVVEAVDAGADLAIVMAVNRPVFTLVGRPGVRDLLALRGAAVGVDNGRTGYVHLLRALFRRAGLADGDYTVSDVGGVDARDQALRAGKIQAALLSVPRDLQALADGYVRLADIDQTPEAYTGSVAVASRAWVDGHRQELTGYIRGYRRALAWLYDPAHEAEAIRILGSNVASAPAIGRQIYRESILQKGWLVKDGRVSPVGLTAVAVQMGTAPAAFNPAKYLDSRAYDAATAGEGMQVVRVAVRSDDDAAASVVTHRAQRND